MIAFAPIARGVFTAGAGDSETPPVVIPPMSVEVTREVPAYTHASVIRIANLALQRVGVTQPVASLDEQSKEARVIRQAWDHVRDVTLSSFGWDFATSYVALALVSQDAGPWMYAYRQPADCLMPRSVLGLAHVRKQSERIPFATASDVGGPLIVSDAPDAVLCYTRRVIDPVDWPAWFQNHLAWMLAAEIAMPLAVDVRMAQVLEQKAALSLRQAAGSSAVSAEPVRDAHASSFLTARA